MPARQGTFHIVPATLASPGPSRPPMTSKAAKKAHRQATKLPSYSVAEQRRLQAAELELQRKEYEQRKKQDEKERSAARAKNAREKKLRKENEEKEERRRRGMAEKSKWVRPSQPSIKGFTETLVSKKRTRDDSESDSTSHDERHELRAPRKIDALEPEGYLEDDEFGDFPSISQGDLPGFLELADETFNSETEDFKPEETTQQKDIHVKKHRQTRSFSRSLRTGPAQAVGTTRTSTEDLDHMKEKDTFSTLIENQPLTKTMYSNAKTRLRKPLQAISVNMAPPLLPQKTRHPVVASKEAQPVQQIQQHQISAMPSTQAFLESHWDDFFPSPSQQVRELLEELDTEQDIPSNTQIARELDEPETKPQKSVRDSKSGDLDDDLQFLSSQDFIISSQDLREMGSIGASQTVASKVPTQTVASQEADLGLKHMATSASLVPKAQSKPRFFEEKEDDLLQAALRESLLSTNKVLWSSSPFFKTTDAREVPSLATEDDSYEAEFDGSDNGWIDTNHDDFDDPY